jgi:U3 small nucleolar RNA-associated protein 14
LKLEDFLEGNHFGGKHANKKPKIKKINLKDLYSNKRSKMINKIILSEKLPYLNLFFVSDKY